MKDKSFRLYYIAPLLSLVLMLSMGYIYSRQQDPEIASGIAVALLVLMLACLLLLACSYLYYVVKRPFFFAPFCLTTFVHLFAAAEVVHIRMCALDYERTQCAIDEFYDSRENWNDEY